MFLSSKEQLTILLLCITGVAIYQYFVTATGDETLENFRVQEGFEVDMAFGFQKNSGKTF